MNDYNKAVQQKLQSRLRQAGKTPTVKKTVSNSSAGLAKSMKPKTKAVKPETVQVKAQAVKRARASVANGRPTIMYGGYRIPKAKQAQAVPQNVNKIHLPLTDKRVIALSYLQNKTCLLIGHAGTGKTTAIKELASKLEQGYTRISMTGYTTPDDLIGTKSVHENGSTYYEQGILTNAMTKGHVVCIDEVNAITPDTSFILHSLLDDDKTITLPNGDIIKPHEDFRVYMTMNPNYDGTKTLNLAFMDRISYVLQVKTLTPKREAKLLTDRHGISSELADRLVALAWLNRRAFNDNKTSSLITTRALLDIAELMASGLDMKQAYISAVVNKVDTSESKAFMELYYIACGKGPDVDLDSLPKVLMPEDMQAIEDKYEQYETTIKVMDERYSQLDGKLDFIKEKQAKTIKHLRSILHRAVK